MSCLLCALDNQAEFPVQMLLHFSGSKNLDKLGVRVFSKLLVCMGCGFSQFTVPEPGLAFACKWYWGKRSLNSVEELGRKQLEQK